METDQRTRFEQTFLPHMAAAYNLARWLLRDEHEAEDLVQEAYLRAWKSFATFHAADGRPWLLTIVRNSCYSRLRQKQARGVEVRLDEQSGRATEGDAQNPVSVLVRQEERQSLQQALEALPVEFREVVILRELEGLSYKQIAAVADISIGTVMSRLSRGRALLQRPLAGSWTGEP